MDTFKAFLLGLGAVAGSITTVIGLIKLIAIPIHNRHEKEKRFRKSIMDSISTLKQHSEENYRATLRLTIINENMPLSERIVAGDKYIKLGGNGAVKQIYKQLLKEYEKELNNERFF